jgi:hypothetical protein
MLTIFRTAVIALVSLTLAPAHLLAAPTKMQAMVQTTNGLQLQTVDTPVPGAGQVLIKVCAAGVNAGYAQYAIAIADETIRKPASFTFEQAGGIPVAGIAGFRSVEAAHILRGQRVAIALAETAAAQDLNRNSDTIGKIILIVDPKAAQR